MKKVLIALSVCAVFAACNSGSTNSEAKGDSTAVTTATDSTKMAAPDSTKMDSTKMAAPATDTTKK